MLSAAALRSGKPRPVEIAATTTLGSRRRTILVHRLDVRVLPLHSRHDTGDRTAVTEIGTLGNLHRLRPGFARILRIGLTRELGLDLAPDHDGELLLAVRPFLHDGLELGLEHLELQAVADRVILPSTGVSDETASRHRLPVQRGTLELGVGPDHPGL